jgi:hypothetical protein
MLLSYSIDIYYKKRILMFDKDLKLIMPGQTGYGWLIEHDAGYIDPKDNTEFINEVKKIGEEGSIISDPLIVTVVLQKYDTENKNGRWYSEHILKREAKKYEILINNRGAVGQSDHPESSIISVNDVSHEIKEIWWEGNTLMGKMEIIMSPGFVKLGIVSTKGDMVALLLSKGIRVGVSSRGVGSLEKVDGKNMVQDDYDLICWDIVMQPSTPGSYILHGKKDSSSFMENVDKKENLVENQKLKNTLNSFLDIL